MPEAKGGASPAALQGGMKYAAAVTEYWRRRPTERRVRISKVGTPELYKAVYEIMHCADAPVVVAAAAAPEPAAMPPAKQRAPRKSRAHKPVGLVEAVMAVEQEAMHGGNVHHEDSDAEELLTGLGLAKGGLAMARAIVHHPALKSGGLSATQVRDLKKILGSMHGRKSRAMGAGLSGGGRSGGALRKVQPLRGGDIYDGVNLDVDADYQGGDIYDGINLDVDADYQGGAYGEDYELPVPQQDRLNAIYM